MRVLLQRARHAFMRNRRGAHGVSRRLRFKLMRRGSSCGLDIGMRPAGIGISDKGARPFRAQLGRDLRRLGNNK